MRRVNNRQLLEPLLDEEGGEDDVEFIGAEQRDYCKQLCWCFCDADEYFIACMGVFDFSNKNHK